MKAYCVWQVWTFLGEILLEDSFDTVTLRDMNNEAVMRPAKYFESHKCFISAVWWDVVMKDLGLWVKCGEHRELCCGEEEKQQMKKKRGSVGEWAL